MLNFCKLMKSKYLILLLCCLYFVKLYSQTPSSQESTKCPELNKQLSDLRIRVECLGKDTAFLRGEIKGLIEEKKQANKNITDLKSKIISLDSVIKSLQKSDSIYREKKLRKDSLYKHSLKRYKDSLRKYEDTLKHYKEDSLPNLKQSLEIIKNNLSQCNKEKDSIKIELTRTREELNTTLEQLDKKNNDFKNAFKNFIIPKYSKQINRVIGLSEEESIKKTFKPIATYKCGNGYKTKKLKANRVENLSYVGFSFWLDTSKYNGAKYNYKVYTIALLIIKKTKIENTISVSDYGSGSFTLPSKFFTKGTRYKIEILNANGTLMYTYFFRFKEKKSTTSISMGYSVSQFNRN